MSRNRNPRRQGEGLNEAFKPKGMKVARLLELPAAALPNMAHIELLGNREAIVDGCKGVLEYDENVVRLHTGKITLRFTGSDLSIKSLTADQAIIEGIILNIEFLS